VAILPKEIALAIIPIVQRSLPWHMLRRRSMPSPYTGATSRGARGLRTNIIIGIR
jgi:hypothetical protein